MTISVLECKRCGHEWPTKQKANRVKVCPKCKTPYWDRLYREKAHEQVTEKKGKRHPNDFEDWPSNEQNEAFKRGGR